VDKKNFFVLVRNFDSIICLTGKNFFLTAKKIFLTENVTLPYWKNDFTLLEILSGSRSKLKQVSLLKL
jgi:hypothetical protein